MNPTRDANRTLKHTNPQFYIGKTEVRSRTHWSGGALLGTKIHPVGPLITHFNVAKQAFPATKRPKDRSYVLQCLALRFHCTHDVQIMQLAPKVWAHVVQNCILSDTCGHIGDLLGPFLTHINTQKHAFPATNRPKSSFYVIQCLALRFHCTHCAQIVESLVFLK